MKTSNLTSNLKRFLSAALLAVATTAPAYAGDVGVSISVGQPGFYGHIDIGNFPQPLLIYPKPVMILQSRGEAPPPMYLHVPPGHAKNWGKYCRKYDACGRPVYFVQESWYNDVYVPGYRERGGDRNEYRDNDRGRGRDKEHGHGHGKGRD